MKRTSSTIAVCAALIAAGAAQGAEVKTTCTRGEDARVIEVVAPGNVGQSCDVRYARGGNVSTPYHADNSDTFCNEKARELVATLSASGFSCAAAAPALRADAASDYVVEARRAAPVEAAPEAPAAAETQPQGAPETSLAGAEPAQAAMEPALVAVAEEAGDAEAALEEEMNQILAQPAAPAIAQGEPAQLMARQIETPAQTPAARPQPASEGRLVGAAPDAPRPATPVTEAALATAAPQAESQEPAAPEPEPAVPAAAPAPAAQPEKAPAPPAQLRTPRDVILATLMAQAAAWNEGDLDGFMSAYWNSDDLKFVSGVNITRGFSATQKRYRERYGGGAGLGQLSFDNIDVKQMTDDVAVTTGRFNLVRGAEVLSGVFTLVLRRDGGAWRIVHDHTSADPATN